MFVFPSFLGVLHLHPVRKTPIPKITEIADLQIWSNQIRSELPRRPPRIALDDPPIRSASGEVSYPASAFVQPSSMPNSRRHHPWSGWRPEPRLAHQR